MLLLLEDDADRLTRFTAAIRTFTPDLPIHTWRDAHKMSREAGVYLPSTVVISLDHDLEPESRDADPGDGVDAVKWLVSQTIVVPVVVHSSNRFRALAMADEFDQAGWRHWRVPPLGEDWIEEDWLPTVRGIILRTAKGL